jgi:hypothetical protein
MVKPEEDIAAWINQEVDSGASEADPFSFAAVGMRVLLEYALDDGISGAMSAEEFHSLELMAHMLGHLTDQAPDPRAA